MDAPRSRNRGQVLVIVVGAMIALLAFVAIVIDVSWYWSSSLRVQRAADAAALAGVIFLPGDVGLAHSTALAEASRNGYTDGSGDPGACGVDKVCVTAVPDPAYDRRLIAEVSAPVDTFFARIFGITTIRADRVAKAEYVLPVPMGSPLNYYGVYQLCDTTNHCDPEPDAVSGTLPSQGFFGSIEGEGTNRVTGDAFATYYNGKPTVNSQYVGTGYDYTIEAPQGSDVWVFDPTFCATAANGKGHAGAGDHWLGPSDPAPVSTYFQLWNTNNTPWTTLDDIQVTSSGSLFAHEQGVDEGTTYGDKDHVAYRDEHGDWQSAYADKGAPTAFNDCSAGKIGDPSQGGYWHNKWWPLASGLGAGTYYLRVMTTDPNNQGLNLGQSFENMWSIEVSTGARIYGGGRMETYANIQSGSQLFYLAQVDRVQGAGKTMEIDLFDPGDVGDKAWLQILSPDGNTYTPATFNFTFDSNGTSPQARTGQTCIQTFANSSSTSPPAGCPDFNSGDQFFGNSWLTIKIPLSSSYGATGLTPPGEPAAGWWKIKYTVNSGNDTTTWMVSLTGNPVHLIVP